MLVLARAQGAGVESEDWRLIAVTRGAVVRALTRSWA